MQHIKNISTKNTKYFSLTLLFLTVTALILFSPAVSAKGAIYGLKLCSTVVIPSLLPFTTVSIFFVKSGALEWVGKLINNPVNKFFKISGAEFTAVIISLFGGYPVGAKILDTMYLEGLIDKKRAEGILRFCVNASPAFYISVVGESVFGSSKLGLILFVANMLSTIILSGINGRILNRQLIPYKKIYKQEKLSLSDNFVISVAEAARVMINICAYIILFSSLLGYLKVFFKSGSLYTIICALFEVTIGCFELSKHNIPIHLFSVVLAFGGFSSIFQVKQSASSINIPIFKIVFYRLIHGVFSAIIAKTLLNVFKISYATIGNLSAAPTSVFSLSIPSISLLIFAIFFLVYLNDNQQTVNF